MFNRPRRAATRSIVTVTVIAASLAIPAAAGDWANWRGPNHNGTTDESNLPSQWSGTENIRWTTPLPGPSAATPVIFGDRVFIASNDTTLKRLMALCFDRETGEFLWGKQLAEADWLPVRNTMCASSPVTDGKLVYFFYGTSDLFALDFDGNVVWSKNLDREVGPTSSQFAYGGSPLLYKGKLYFPILRGQWRSSIQFNSYSDKDSFLVCIDAATGDLLWKIHRPSDAKGESFDSYASAVPYEYGGAESVIVQGGDYLTGHGAETGEELWRQFHSPKKGNTGRLIPTPVVAGELVIGVQPRGCARKLCAR